jgi:hypothetical protein
MNRKILNLTASSLFCLGFVACMGDGTGIDNGTGTGGSSGGCISGMSNECTCPGNPNKGAQICTNGSYGACDCGPNPGTGGATSTGGSTPATTGGASGTGGASSTGGMTGSGGAAPTACTPNATQTCKCTDGSVGSQTCKSDGSGFGTCTPTSTGTGGATVVTGGPCGSQGTKTITFAVTGPAGHKYCLGGEVAKNDLRPDSQATWMPASSALISGFTSLNGCDALNMSMSCSVTICAGNDLRYQCYLKNDLASGDDQLHYACQPKSSSTALKANETFTSNLPFELVDNSRNGWNCQSR